MRRRDLLTAIGLGLVPLGGCRSVADDAAGEGAWVDGLESEWPTARGNLARTGRDPTIEGPKNEGELAWKRRLHRIRATSPVVADGTVVVAASQQHMPDDPRQDVTPSGGLYALSAEDGTVEWSFEPEIAGYNPTPTVFDDHVLVPDEGGIRALDESDGSTLWITDNLRIVPDERFSPIVRDGTVYVHDGINVVSAVSAEDGSKQWSTGTWDPLTDSTPTETPPSETVTPESISEASYQYLVGPLATMDETLYATGKQDGTGALFEIDVATGALTRTETFGSDVSNGPTVGRDRIYVTLEEGDDRDEPVLVALSRDDHTELWRTGVGTPGSPPALRGSTVYHGSNMLETDSDTIGGLKSISADDGSVKWRYERDVHSQVSVTAETIYFGSNDRVHAISTGGEDRWETTLEQGTIRSGPAIGDGSIFVGSRDGYVFSISERG